VLFDAEFGRAELVPDPVTGKWIMLGRDASCNKKMYEYDPATDNWTMLSVNIPSGLLFADVSSPGNYTAGSMAAAAITDLGVIMFWNEAVSDQGGNVWIYKHSGSVVGDTTASSTPIAVPITNGGG